MAARFGLRKHCGHRQAPPSRRTGGFALHVRLCGRPLAARFANARRLLCADRFAAVSEEVRPWPPWRTLSEARYDSVHLRRGCGLSSADIPGNGRVPPGPDPGRQPRLRPILSAERYKAAGGSCFSVLRLDGSPRGHFCSGRALGCWPACVSAPRITQLSKLDQIRTHRRGYERINKQLFSGVQGQFSREGWRFFAEHRPVGLNPVCATSRPPSGLRI